MLLYTGIYASLPGDEPITWEKEEAMKIKPDMHGLSQPKLACPFCQTQFVTEDGDNNSGDMPKLLCPFYDWK